MADDEDVKVHTFDPGPEDFFHGDSYRWLNDARMTHLLGLLGSVVPTEGTVLEVAAGIGDLTPFWSRRGYAVTATEARAGNIALFTARRPDVPILQHDLESETPLPGPADIVHAYGVLYHLAEPAHALAQMARACKGMLLLETCVSFGDDAGIHPVAEPKANPTQALRGRGCRPTRRWVWEALRAHFPHVYIPRTQPDHPEFPLDWSHAPADAPPLARAMFIASRSRIEADVVSEDLLLRQTLA